MKQEGRNKKDRILDSRWIIQGYIPTTGIRNVIGDKGLTDYDNVNTKTNFETWNLLTINISKLKPG